MNQQRCKSLVLLLSLCHISTVQASSYNRMQSSFNPLARMGIRGGETTTATVTDNATPAIPKFPTSSALAEFPTSSALATATTVATPKVVVKKKRRKKTTSLPQAPAPVPPKVVSAPVPPPPEVVSVPVPVPVPAPVVLPPPPVPLDIPKIAEEKTQPKKEESKHDQMPSIFTKPDETQYDTYAACLAATESLRRMRDSTLKNKKGTAVDPDDNSWKSMLKVSGTGAGSENEPVGKEEHKRACAEYVLNSSKAINALGLSVTQFNQLGREVAKNKPLKEKVMEQAYLYRMASTIKMDKIPLIQDPDSKQLLKSTRRRRVQMFVRSITEIEELREEQTKRLRKSLNIDKLPSNVNLCDPNVMPLLSPQVRAVIAAFPLQAEEIVKKYGLNSDEFNQMLEETRGNPVFRWRVQRFKNRQDEEE